MKHVHLYFSLALALILGRSAVAGLGEATQGGDIFYVPMAARVERYNLATRQWLAPLNFSEAVTGVYADTNHLYLAFGRRVSRFDLAGQNETHVSNFPYDVKAILGWNRYIYVNFPAYPYGHLASISKETLATIFTWEPLYGLFEGASLSATPPKIFGRSAGSSPGDIYFVNLSAAGSFDGSGESPYHGAYPEGNKTYAFPNGARVADNSGTVYNSSDLTYNGSLAGAFADLSFANGEQPIVLRGSQISGYSQALLPTGSVTVTLANPTRVCVNGDQILVFGPAANEHGIDVQAIPLSSLALPTPGEPVNPVGLPYTPDDLFLDKNNVLHLFTRSLQSVFRWDTATRTYLRTIPLVGTPTHVAYSAANHTAYFAHVNGLIEKMDLSSTNPVQVPFVNSPQRPLGLATAGSYVFVCDAASPWVTHYTYNSMGGLVSSRDWNYYSAEYIWNPATSRMFFFRDDTSPNDLLAEVIESNGALGARIETPYHGDYPIVHPIRVNPAGTRILLGSGHVYEGAGLSRASGIANGISDAAWLPQDLLTLREVAGVAQLQRWDAGTYEALGAKQFAGPPLRILPLESKALALTKEFGSPRFHIIQPNLTVEFSSSVPPLAPTNLLATNITPTTVTLRWNDLSDNEQGFHLFMLDNTNANWRLVATVSPNTTNYTVADLAFKTYYDFKVRAFNEVSATDFTAPVSIRTLPDPRGPLGPPWQLRATRALATEIYLQWQDNANNEDGFVLERRTGATFAEIARLAANTTTFVDSNRVANTTYYYRIHSYNGFAESDPSNELMVRTLSSNSAVPATPTGFTLGQLLAREVNLSWNDVASNEDEYIVERAPGETPTLFTEIGRVSANSTNFQDRSVVPGTAYRYRLFASNSNGRSSSNVLLNVTTPPIGGLFQAMSQRFGNIAYFLFSAPARLERYDLTASAWLSPLLLPEAPTAFLVSTDGIYLSFGRKLSQFDLNLQNERFLLNLEGNGTILFDSGGYIFASAGGYNYTSVNRTNGTVAWQGQPSSYTLAPRLAVTPLGKVFGRTANVSPADILTFQVNTNGSISGAHDSPYHGSYPGANALFLFPNNARVVDSAGIVYNTADLTYSGSLAGAVDDISFHGSDVPIASRGRTIVAFSQTLLPTGSFDVDVAPSRIFVEGTNVFAFAGSASATNGFAVEKVPLAALNPSIPGQAPQFFGVPFTPEDYFVDKNGVVNLLSKQMQCIFRWSTVTHEELPTIPLLGGPSYVAYSAPLNRIFLAYGSGAINQIKLDQGLGETPFANLPTAPRGLATAGDILFAVDSSGAWGSHWTFAATGALLASRDWEYYSKEYIWNPATRKMFFFRDDTSPNDLLYETIGVNGEIGAPTDSPYHGEVGTQHPIRVSPEGAVVLLGSGQIYNGQTLLRESALPSSITDATWFGSTLFTIRDVLGVTQIQRWSAGYGQTAVRQINGKPLRILASGTNLVVITSELDQPRIRIIDNALADIHVTPINLPPTAITLTPATIPENNSLGQVVGQLASADSNSGDTHFFTLIDGANTFRLVGSSVQATQFLNFEATQSFTINVRATDNHGAAFATNLLITIQNQNEAPTNILLSQTTITENLAIGTNVASITIQDPDGPSVQSLSLADDSAGTFDIVNDKLVLRKALSFASTPVHNIRIRAQDPGGLAFEKAFAIMVAEFLPPPSTGEVVLRFELASTNSPATNAFRWLEAGLRISSTNAFEISASTTSSNADNGTANLRAASALVITNTGNLIFRVISIDVAEAAIGSESRTIRFEGVRAGQSNAVHIVQLDARNDGNGPGRDFETIYLPSTFENVTRLTISGAPLVVDNLRAVVGALSKPFVWLRPVRDQAYESEANHEDGVYPNTATFVLERMGFLTQTLPCQLTLGGAAEFLEDYFLANVPLNNVVTFYANERTVAVELYPWRDTLAEDREEVTVSLIPSSAYTAGQSSTGKFYIHDSAMTAWFAAQYPMRDPTALPQMDLSADADGNGLCSLAEYAMALSPGSPRPGYAMTRVAGGIQFEALLPWNPAVRNWKYSFETSSDLTHWMTIPVSGVLLGGDSAKQTYRFQFTLPESANATVRLNIIPAP